MGVSAGVGVGVEIAVGAGVGVAVGVGAAVGTGEGAAVGIGVGTAVGCGVTGPGLNGPHVLNNTTSMLVASARMKSSLGTRRYQACGPCRVDVESRVEFFRAMQPRCSENVPANKSTIAHP